MILYEIKIKWKQSEIEASALLYPKLLNLHIAHADMFCRL